MNIVRNLAFVACLFAALPALGAFDDSKQCPGKSEPRTDIVRCLSNDESSKLCATGTETDCRVANGYPTDMNRSLAIKHGGAAVGGGYLLQENVWAGPGTFQPQPLPPAQREFSLRYYIRHDAGYQEYTASTPHRMEIAVRGGAGACGGSSVQIDGAQSGYDVVRGNCPDGRLPLWRDKLFNGRWFRVEMYGRMESSCRDASRGNGGCDGYFAVYLDGVKKFESNTYNWAGGSSTASFASLVVPRDYYHVGYPKWAPSISWDNIVIGNRADLPIGAASTENPRGIAQPLLYWSSSGANPMIHLRTDPMRSLRPVGDCSTFSVLVQGWDAFRGNGLFKLVDEYNAGGVDWLGTGGCRYSGPVADGALQLKVAPSTARAGFLSALAESIGRGPLAAVGYDFVVGGKIFVPRDVSFEGNPIVAGLASTGPSCIGQFCQWIGVTIEHGLWAVAELYTTTSRAPEVLATGTPAIRGIWHTYEVMVTKAGTVDLWIDGTKVITNARAQNAPGGAINAGFVGVSHLATTTSTFTLYFDDIYWSTVSREKCYGDWGSDCPRDMLGSSRPPLSTTRPNPPTRLN